MKDIFTKFGAVAVALAMSGLPAVAFAEDGGQEQSGDIQVTSVQAEQVQQVGEVNREAQKQSVEISREQEKQQLEASSSLQREERDNGQEIDFDLEDDSDRAVSIADLKQKIEMRKQELDQEEASTTESRKDIIKNANPVRLAVHALLASKDLVDGIGQQVSEIAKQMNDSVATTTNVEAKVQARGFITRLLFGGDKASGEAIAKAVEKNQENIAKLTELLAQANIGADVQATLNAQIAALKDAQTRLQALADKERNTWGLFSWRF
ncbi:MAG: hypothetical protein PHV99_01785 [Candidatus Pacebacteria bacterium]|nr:hypothetical protein [Candidatus Paceibacterota bacterium]